MVTEVKTAALYGIDSRIITVETDISSGLPGIELIGSAGSEVRESKERVRVSLKNNGIVFPPCRITINLSPADIKKEGTSYDLPIAISMLIGMGTINCNDIDKMMFAGEIGLNGEIKHIKGILPMALAAKDNGFKAFVVPKSNIREAMVVSGIKIIGISHLSELIKYLNASEEERKLLLDKDLYRELDLCISQNLEYKDDFKDVSGQESVKRAMEIAASGFHNLLMIGPPGAGKSMMACRLPSILPPLSLSESMQVSKIYSVCGLLNNDINYISKRPFLAPHHSITQSAMTGGGKNPTPGIISKAHKGVLFLDEVVHFPSNTLEVLRQPIEDKKIHVVRTNWNYTFPADFMLVAAMNPCPCGYFPDRNKCSCTSDQIRKYIGKISGPILDRFDICVETGRIDIRKTKSLISRSSEEMRENVIKSIEVQKNRYKNTDINFNSQLTANLIEEFIHLGRKEKEYIDEMYEKMNLSVRGYHRILKVARTIADIEGSKEVLTEHLMEALSYRGIEEKYWGGLS